jgi:hypothetical protein
MTWMKKLNASNQAIACYVSVEMYQGVPEVERVMPMTCTAIRQYTKDFDVPIPPSPTDSIDPGSHLSQTLTNFASREAKTRCASGWVVHRAKHGERKHDVLTSTANVK